MGLEKITGKVIDETISGRVKDEGQFVDWNDRPPICPVFIAQVEEQAVDDSRKMTDKK